MVLTSGSTATTLRLTPKFLVKAEVVSVIVTTSEKLPRPSALAAPLNEQVTVVEVPGASMPPAEERVVHGWVLDAVQFSGAAPEFVSV